MQEKEMARSIKMTVLQISGDSWWELIEYAHSMWCNLNEVSALLLQKYLPPINSLIQYDMVQTPAGYTRTHSHPCKDYIPPLKEDTNHCFFNAVFALHVANYLSIIAFLNMVK
jgi:hypothetical protein